MTDTSGNTLAYSYGTDGLRTEKTYTPVNGTEYYERYYYSESALCYIVYTGGVMSFLYDANGGLLSTNVNGTNYIYLKNAQGDIIGLADKLGNVVVEYTYDAWGNILSVTGSLAGTLGQDNPFRYRSYCYDDETGLYYLGSRYYDPEVGRFINADGQFNAESGLIGVNLFAYCENNPVNRCDPTGNNWIVNGKSYWYDGSSLDFSRMNKGLPPLAYELAVMASALINISSTENSNKLPLIGEKNSTQRAPNGNEREYGTDGKALKDNDYSHPEHHPELLNPHSHDWTWDNGIPHRGNAHNFDSGLVVLGLGLVVISGIAITAIAVDDISIVGITDDFLMVPLSGGLGEGLVLITEGLA